MKVCDPIVINECCRRLGEEYYNDMYKAAIDADALLLITEWN